MSSSETSSVRASGPVGTGGISETDLKTVERWHGHLILKKGEISKEEKDFFSMVRDLKADRESPSGEGWLSKTKRRIRIHFGSYEKKVQKIWNEKYKSIFESAAKNLEKPEQVGKIRSILDEVQLFGPKIEVTFDRRNLEKPKKDESLALDVEMSSFVNGKRDELARRIQEVSKEYQKEIGSLDEGRRKDAAKAIALAKIINEIVSFREKEKGRYSGELQKNFEEGMNEAIAFFKKEVPQDCWSFYHEYVVAAGL